MFRRAICAFPLATTVCDFVVAEEIDAVLIRVAEGKVTFQKTKLDERG
jgi:hypothetical protein